jgi:hypothetical protein
MFAPFEYRLSFFKIDRRLIYETDYRDGKAGLSNGRAPPLPPKNHLPKGNNDPSIKKRVTNWVRLSNNIGHQGGSSYGTQEKAF